MTHNGLLARRTYQTKPPRAEYLVTAAGPGVWPVLVSIWEWERHWVPDQPNDCPRMHHTACGDDFAPLLTCRACSEPVTEKDIGVRWGPSGSWPRSIPVRSTRRRSRPIAPGRGRPVPPDDEHAGQSMGVRLAGGRLRRHHAGSTTSQTARCAAGSLADRLQIFTANGVVVAANGPARPEYRLTEKGRAVFPVLITALQWAQRWFPRPKGPRLSSRTRAAVGGSTRCWPATNAPARSPVHT